MATISLNPIYSGYSTGLINDNFQILQDQLNQNFLRRDSVANGQANQMEVDLDMNGNSLLNVSTDETDPSSLLTVGSADSRYINVSGDSMSGPLSVLEPTESSNPIRKDQFDTEHNQRISRENSIESGYQQADANIQSQLTGTVPLEASAFSEISWHGQSVNNSVVIPDGQNAWSIGPEMTVASGQSVTIGTGSFWTIVEGSLV